MRTVEQGGKAGDYSWFMACESMLFGVYQGWRMMAKVRHMARNNPPVLTAEPDPGN
jgi:hypothetical protein